MADATATLRCNCGCAFLVIDKWEWDDDADDWYAEVYTLPRPNTLRHRLKTAWRIARGKDPWMDSLVFSPQTLGEMREFLDKHA